MIDLRAKLDQFRTDATECEEIAQRATERSKYELYWRLAIHYRELAADIDKLISGSETRTDPAMPRVAGSSP